jgi:GTP cyclohydrolase I
MSASAHSNENGFDTKDLQKNISVKESGFTLKEGNGHHHHHHHHHHQGKNPPVLTEETVDELKHVAKTLIVGVGEDPNREGLLKTPERYAKAIKELTKGYTTNLEEIVNGAVFESESEDMILVRNIDLFSMCEHHLLPFFGKVHIAYIPNKKILGLSKLARISEIYSRRLQIQERLTHQIAKAIYDTVQPHGVAVVIEATHMCMVIRGAQKTQAETLTSCMLGIFRTDNKTREEFLKLLSTSR